MEAGNATRVILAQRKARLVQNLLLGAILFAYYGASSARTLGEIAARVHHVGPWAFSSALAAVFVLGLWVGWLSAAWAFRYAFAPWLAAQPIGLRQRLRAVAAIALALDIGWAFPVGGALGAIGHAYGPSLVLAMAASALAFLLGGVAGTAANLAAMARNSGSDMACVQARLNVLSGSARAGASSAAGFGFIEKLRPRWLGAWMLGEARRSLPGPAIRLILFAAFAALLGVAAAAGLVQKSSAPATVAGVLGAVVAFARMARFSALDSPVLRANPLGFFAAFLGVVRLPFAMALAVYAPMGALAAFSDAAQWRVAVAGGLAATGLILLYACMGACTPRSAKQAAFLFAGALAVAADEAPSLREGALSLLVLAALIALTVARRRYKLTAR